MPHRLEPLLRPRSVAVVGASATPNSLGAWALENLLKGGFDGPIYPVNPSRDAINDLTCYARIGDVPEVPDLVMFAVSDQRIEAALDEVIEAGVPAAVIMSTLAIDDDASPNLKERVQDKNPRSGNAGLRCQWHGFL